MRDKKWIPGETCLNDLISLTMNLSTKRLIKKLDLESLALVDLIAAKIVTVPTEEVWPLMLIQRVSDKWAMGEQVYQGAYACPQEILEWNRKWRHKRITREAVIKMMEAFDGTA